MHGVLQLSQLISLHVLLILFRITVTQCQMLNQLAVLHQAAQPGNQQGDQSREQPM